MRGDIRCFVCGASWKKPPRCLHKYREESDPLLGSLALEVFSLAVDPVNNRLGPTISYLTCNYKIFARFVVPFDGKRTCVRLPSNRSGFMSNLQYFFDREADVLYVSKGAPRADVESEEVGDGVIARLDPVTKEVVGFTILNFLKRTEQGLPAVVLPFRVDLGLAS